MLDVADGRGPLSPQEDVDRAPVDAAGVAPGRLDRAVEAARLHLLGLQREDGHWCAELEGDTILESEYVMLLWYLGRHDDPRIEQACRTLREKQLATGGWSIYPGGPVDPSASVKAYFALRLAGDDPGSEPMRRACAAIRAQGGIANTNSFTKIYLAIFQQWPWSRVPAVPPELILTPRWFLLNVAEMSAWSRAIVVPLAMIWALKPRCEVPVRIDELITGDPAGRPGRGWRERFWFAFFRGVDRTLKLAEAVGAFRPIRARSLAACERWTLDRLPMSAGLAGIFPAIANAVVALHERGYAVDHPAVASQLRELEKLELLSAREAGDALRLQPCCSPVWDTALSSAALLEAGQSPSSPEIQRAVEWLIRHQTREGGDWLAQCRRTEPGGWYFEYANEFYPDCDDTAEVLAVLEQVQRSSGVRPADLESAVERGVCWLLAMQNEDGGWAAFDRGCDRELLTFVPFADHNAMLDPSTADVTSRAVEAICGLRGERSAAVQRGADFLERVQEGDGSWYGRWGCNYLYGTWLALCALSRIGRADGEAVAAGVRWLLSVQLADGGWGETLDTYADPSRKGAGPATAAQTAWALMGLMAPIQRSGGPALGDLEAPTRAAIERGVEFLCRTQRSDGSWLDEQWTGTGFPEVFYLRYHYYDRYFPLQALAQARALARPPLPRVSPTSPDVEG